MKRMVLVLIAPLLMIGCANLNSIYRSFDIAEGKGAFVDIRQRAVLVSPNETVTEITYNGGKTIDKKSIMDKRMLVCAEPSPDAMASLAYELAAKGGIPEQVTAELAFAMQDSAAFTGIRTQSIQLLRDFGYRLCESYLSGAITPAQYDLLMRRFQKNTVALLAIEQLTGTVKSPPIVLTSIGKAEATKSLVEQRAEREKVAEQISDLEKQRQSIQDKIDEAKKADPKKDTSEMVKQIADLEGKVKRLKSDIEAIDTAIANTKSVLATGRTNVEIKNDVTTSQRSDADLQKIADVVKSIVKNITESDDQYQICMYALQSSGASLNGQQNQFNNLCIRYLDNKANIDRVRIAYLENKSQDPREEVREEAIMELEEMSNEKNYIAPFSLPQITPSK